jgi:hypothetical protein
MLENTSRSWHFKLMPRMQESISSAEFAIPWLRIKGICNPPNINSNHKEINSESQPHPMPKEPPVGINFATNARMKNERGAVATNAQMN